MHTESSELKQRLIAAVAERDRALEELSQARAELNRLRLRFAHPEEAASGDWIEAGRAALPLRYRVADRLNDGARMTVGRAHTLLKRLMTRA